MGLFLSQSILASLNTPIFQEVSKNGYFIKSTDRDVWQCVMYSTESANCKLCASLDLWQSGLTIVDLASPEGRAWYKFQLVPLMNLGMHTFTVS
jgi:hypothetical protein